MFYLAAGGLGILFVSAIPAMYRLNLFSDDPNHSPADDIGKLIALTASTAFFGMYQSSVFFSNR